jgi:hypothetical protein
MKSRIRKINIQNFKAFREFSLNLEERNLLVYGANGSGKSSLYWALYTFLQSAGKSEHSISKYFTPGAESLLNIHEDATAKPGLIAVTLRDTITNNDTTYHISETDHGTFNQPLILTGDLASDFINYRFFFGFSHFRNSQKFDLWPLFEKEILPFCKERVGIVPQKLWNEIKTGDPNPLGCRGLAGASSYEEFHRKTGEFSTIITSIVDDISAAAQKFYHDHFSEDDPAPVILRLGVTTKPTSTGNNQTDFSFTVPVIEFGVQIDGTTIPRPQSYLNEAKMTQLALSFRFAASLVNLHEAALKLLVLDDLLVSLDMSNRMKVVEILLSDTFAKFQKIILTHDLGMFDEFRRKLFRNHTDWCFIHLEGTPTINIASVQVKTEFEKVEEYIAGFNLDEAALCLRKVAEDTATRFLGRDNNVQPTNKFSGLRNRLKQARDKVLSELPVELYEEVLRNTPDGRHSLLIPTDDSDLDAIGGLESQTRDLLKDQRVSLRRLITQDHLEQLRRVKLIDDVLACTARVLNPSAHSGNSPLYKKEVTDALDLIRQLEVILPGGRST